jgi:indole-3-glycerol phosphate synthase
MSRLASIVERKRAEIDTAKSRVPIGALESVLEGLAPCRALAASLSVTGGPTRIIAEIKRASPSAGVIGQDVDVVALSRLYRDHGASAISVLTDAVGFGGSLDDLRDVRAEVNLPVLRKDFIIDRYQLVEARCAGADAVLLIVAALPPSTLRQLHDAALAVGLEVLVEAHDEVEVEIALGLEGCRLVGLNSRNLATFEIDLANVERLLPKVGTGVVVVAESGIQSVGDVARLRGCGFANFLVGEALVRSQDPGALLAGLVGTR